MAQDNRVFFEMECDVELVYNPAHKHNTDIFKSVTGRGRAQIIENPEEKRVFLQALVDRYHDQPITVTPSDADRCTIFTVTVEELGEEGAHRAGEIKNVSCGTGRNRTAVQTSSKKGFYTLSLSFGFRSGTGEKRPYPVLIFLITERIRKRGEPGTDFDCFALRWKRTVCHGFFRKRR